MYIKAPSGPKVAVKVAITTAMKKQILVFWKAQVKLGILPKDYPNVILRNPKKHKKEQQKNSEQTN